MFPVNNEKGISERMRPLLIGFFGSMKIVNSKGVHSMYVRVYVKVFSNRFIFIRLL